jgi:hypothetical protein
MAPAGRDVADPRRGFLDFRRSLAYLARLRLGSQPSKPRTAPAIISIIGEQEPATSAISQAVPNPFGPARAFHNRNEVIRGQRQPSSCRLRAS